MDKPRGWIKYWKKSMFDDMYNQGPFDMWHAWTDLLLLADSEGKLETTIKALKIRWNWTSYKQVRAYLGKLKGKGMVKLNGKPTGTTIYLCKYWTYQASESAKKEAKGQTSGKTSWKTKGQVRSTLSTEGVDSPSPSGEMKPQEEKKKHDDEWELIKENDFDDK